MDKKFQVFVSSTFRDLEGARQEVSNALLRTDCFPAGMELFPAADEEQFEYIKSVIDDSDYYIVISAGKYGSVHKEAGLSFTELEYDYAMEIGKPIIRLLHKDPLSSLKGDQIESTDLGRKNLERFRGKLMESRMVRFWEDPKELGQETVLGLLDIKKRRPAIGWVKANNAVSTEFLKANESLRNELVELKKSRVLKNRDGLI